MQTMNWRQVSKSLALSDCGYEIRMALHVGAKKIFYNAWSPDGRHVSAGFNKAEVKAACERDKAKELAR